MTYQLPHICMHVNWLIIYTKQLTMYKYLVRFYFRHSLYTTYSSSSITTIIMATGSSDTDVRRNCEGRTVKQIPTRGVIAVDEFVCSAYSAQHKTIVTRNTSSTVKHCSRVMTYFAHFSCCPIHVAKVMQGPATVAPSLFAVEESQKFLAVY